ncbi:collagen alpha-1(VII) chain-like [Bacillus rossius redtenbacheri]|uniref:collagen alpha-1(VII) chain-like n=1 Tax=Bacillus rossius redtenbacheri TaxID=93214 RepID=UPI002FDEFE14
MRSLLLLLSLVILVRGDSTSNKNCTASGEALDVGVEYDESYGFGVEWRAPSNLEGCVRRYSVCVTLDGGAPDCRNTSSTWWRTARGDAAACSNYSVAVEAVGEGEEQLARGSVALSSAPAVVTNYTVVNRTSTSLLMSWVAPPNNTCIQRYVLSWRNWTEQQDEASLNLTTETSYEVTGLRPCTMYGMSVAAVTANNVASSNVIYVYTAVQGAPLAVSGVSAKLASPDSITVQWQETSPCVQSYRVCVEPVGGSRNCTHTSGEDLQWTSGTHIQPCTDYNIAVAAMDYTGQYSEDVVIVFAGAPGEVKNLTVASRTEESMTITWADPDSSSSCLNGYEVYLCAKDKPTTCSKPLAALGSEKTSYTAADLTACEDYNVVVRSTGAGGQRSYGYSITTYTDVTDKSSVLANFGADTDFDLASVDVLKLEASWDMPDQTDCLAGYQVCYQEDSGKSGETCDKLGVSTVDWSSTNVDYCSSYSIRVSPLTIDGQAYPEVSANVVTPPHAVTNVTAKKVTGTTIHVTWDLPPTDSSSCTQEYDIHWCPSGAVGCNSDNDTTPGAMVRAGATGHTIRSLSNCTTYLVWVRGVATSGAASEASFMWAKSGGMVPGVVERLSAPRVTCGSVFADWDAPTIAAECAAGYEVCWRAASGADGSTCETIQAPLTQLHVGGLQPATPYNISVAVVGAGSEKSEAIGMRVITRAATPLRGLAVAARTETSALLSWEFSEEDAECAEETVVSWHPMGDNSSREGGGSTRVSANQTRLNITGLLPCTDYVVSVGVADAWGAETPNTTVGMRTLDQSPAAVRELRQLRNGSRLTLTWNSPPALAASCAAGYQVCWRLAGEGDQLPACARASSELFPLGDFLPACRVYRASVRAVAVGGELSRASSATVDLATPGPVVNLTVEGRAADSLELRWGPPPGTASCLVGYWVCREQGSGGDNATCEEVPAALTGHRVAGLRPSTRYNVTVVALGSAGEESEARTVSAVTDAAGKSEAQSSLVYANHNILITSAAVFLTRRYLLFRD